MAAATPPGSLYTILIGTTKVEIARAPYPNKQTRSGADLPGCCCRCSPPANCYRCLISPHRHHYIFYAFARDVNLFLKAKNQGAGAGMHNLSFPSTTGGVVANNGSNSTRAFSFACVNDPICQSLRHLFWGATFCFFFFPRTLSLSRQLTGRCRG